MSYRWVTEMDSGGNAGAGGVSLVVQDSDNQTRITLIPACRDIEEFERALASLKNELEGQIAKAAQAFEAMEVEDESLLKSPEEVWERMKSCATEQEMFDVFNSLDQSLRQETAEHILTQVSMFSGRGPIFAAHYEQISQTLI